MADFTVKIDSGATIEQWVDPIYFGLPSRLNHTDGIPPVYYKVTPPATVVLHAWVDGVDAPLDSALDGRLFQVSWFEYTSAAPPILTQTASQSSEISIAITTAHEGHHMVLVSRASGGSVAVPFEVEV